MHIDIIFCRFHSLVEFDEGKRSCRKRLDGHNRRRRKPQPERNPGLDFSSQHGPTGTTTTSLLSFTTPQILPSSVVGFSWSSGVVKPENEMALYTSPHQQMNYIERPNSFPKHSSPQSYNRGAANNQLHFNIQEATSNNMSQAPLLDPKMYSDGLNHHSSDDRALSLLSSTPTRELGLSHHMVRGEPQLPLAHDLDYGGLGQFHHELADQESCKPVVCSSTTMDSRGNSGSTVHFPGMLEHGAEGSSASGSHQTLTFMWE